MKESATFAAAARPRRSAAGPLVALVERLGTRIGYGTLVVRTPAGELFEFGEVRAGEPRGIWQLHSWRALWALLARGATGLAEAYLAGHWDSPDLTALLQVAAVNERRLGRAAAGSTWLQWSDRLRHRWRANSPRQARRNIAYHYDLGNDFYAAWLDRSMTYSAAMFTAPGETLEAAQARKYASLADLAGITTGDRVLEIGCGWGGFLEYAAGVLDVEVTGVSISRAQVDYVVDRLARRGLSDRARVELRDYRDLVGCYERIVSIEMFEAVGEAYWETYAARLAALLAPVVRRACRIITIAEDRFEQYRRQPDFIQRHVFPGGMLPSKTALEAVLARAGLTVTARHCFGLDYARTLACWRTASRRPGRVSPSWASTNVSGACGCSISPIAKRAFAAAPSTSCNCGSSTPHEHGPARDGLARRRPARARRRPAGHPGGRVAANLVRTRTRTRLRVTGVVLALARVLDFLVDPLIGLLTDAGARRPALQAVGPARGLAGGYGLARAGLPAGAGRAGLAGARRRDPCSSAGACS